MTEESWIAGIAGALPRAAAPAILAPALSPAMLTNFAAPAILARAFYPAVRT